MMRTRPLLWLRFGRLTSRGICAGIHFILIASGLPRAALAADTPAKVDRSAAQKWSAIVEWVGFWDASETRTQKYRNSLNASLWADSLRDAQTSSQFRLRRAINGVSWNPAEGSFEWAGTGLESWASTESSAASDSNAHDLKTAGTGHSDSSSINFQIRLQDGLATFGPGANKIWPEAQMTGWKGTGENRQEVNRPNALLRTIPTIYKGEKHQGMWDFSSAPGVITIDDGKTTNQKQGDTTYGYEYHGHVVLCPVYDDLECEVTIDHYADWVPEGSIEDPKKPGNALLAHAVLKSKKGKNDDIPEVERFRLELIGTSQEPGVCMNWPLGAKDRNYDMKLADFASGSGGTDPAAIKKFMFEWGMMSAGKYDRDSMPDNIPQISFPTVSKDGQKGELIGPPKNKEGQPFADAAIECYDFGARSELRVICVLKDGREIIGLIKGQTGAQDLVRLPKRAPADWIASKWREEADVGNLAASDDNEKVAGQPMNGDGFTLYEEYRGWVVGGKHRQGDPQRKDFFVLNQRGADFRGGIELFGRVSQLRVHSTLIDGSEMGEEERCMNRNHRDAPHRVDQYGVILAKDNGFPGGWTVGVDGVDKSRAFRPHSVAHIYMEWSEAGRGGSTFSIEKGQSYNLSQRDAELAWDRGVAHELLHTVGVDHHGEALREKVCCYFQSANFPLNSSGKHRYMTEYSLSPDFYFKDGRPMREEWHESRGAEITLKWEDTQKDVFEDYLAEYEKELQFYRSNTGDEASQKYLTEVATKLAHAGKSAEWWGRYIDEEAAGYGATRVIWVGAKNGTDSGNDRCVMKYYFAGAYRMNGKDNAYYLIRPGTVHAGREICRSPTGTGTNGTDHSPQSRFSDAAGGRGDCFGQICPNDDIPPRKVPAG